MFQPVTEQWNFLDLSKIFYFWNVVILINHLVKINDIRTTVAIIDSSTTQGLKQAK
jgi:hypothetical protein